MKIKLSNLADKFLKKHKISDQELISLLEKFLKFLKGQIINLDVKKMKGKWKEMIVRKQGFVKKITFHFTLVN